MASDSEMIYRKSMKRRNTGKVKVVKVWGYTGSVAYPRQPIAPTPLRIRISPPQESMLVAAGDAQHGEAVLHVTSVEAGLSF